MNSLYLALLFALLFLGCQSSKLSQRKFDPSLVNQPGTVNAQWFLAPVPSWINFSPRFKCEKEKNFTFVDLSNAMPQLGLSYRQTLELQVRLNSYENFLTLPESEKYKIFFDEMAKVVNKAEVLTSVPDMAKTITIVPIDQLQNQTNWKSALSGIAALPRWNDQVPILVSECLSTATLQNYLSELPNGHPFQWFVGAEYFSVFGAEGRLMNEWSINWELFFPNKKILSFKFNEALKNLETQNQ